MTSSTGCTDVTSLLPPGLFGDAPDDGGDTTIVFGKGDDIVINHNTKDVSQKCSSVIQSSKLYGHCKDQTHVYEAAFDQCEEDYAITGDANVLDDSREAFDMKCMENLQVHGDGFQKW